MSRDVMTAGSKTKVLEICRMMAGDRTGSVVVVDRGAPVGIITEYDVVKALARDASRIARLRARDIMNAPILFLGPQGDIRTASNLMLLERVRRIPVVSRGRLVGMITDRDTVNALRMEVERLENTQDRLKRDMAHDHLTGLLNRSILEKILQREFDRFKRSGGSLSVLMIDLDHFKRVNDQLGHPAGDEVLKSLAHLIEGHTRRVNAVARYGGEEFVIVCPLSGLREAMQLGERLRSLVAKKSFAAAGQSLHLTISVGVAAAHKGTASPESLLKLADEAMYRAKNTGRNRVCSSTK